MGKFKISTAASGAGILSFHDVSAGGPKVDPKTVLFISIGILVLVSILRIVLMH